MNDRVIYLQDYIFLINWTIQLHIHIGVHVGIDIVIVIIIVVIVVIVDDNVEIDGEDGVDKGDEEGEEAKDASLLPVQPLHPHHAALKLHLQILQWDSILLQLHENILPRVGGGDRKQDWLTGGGRWRGDIE